MRLLVTGGDGFIGSNFATAAALAGHEIHVLDVLTYASRRENLADASSVGLTVGDIRDRALVTRLLTQFRPQALLNFAAESHVDRSIVEPADFIGTNVVCTPELL
jgi:dTDP-glucose 4,6-dehydratase